MGPLPASRLQTHLPAFTNVGIDLFGPFSVVILRRSVKRYGVMFTCLDTRAVHLEVADSLDMDSFINAFSRFADRRGVPQLCYSDNGTNLVAGEQEINRALSRWNEAELVQKIEKLKNQPIEWRFSPPVAPHFGGSWERLIKSAKTALRGILNNRSVTEDVLVTAIVGAEALLNSRPLTHVSVNPNDLEAITPNHFLLLRAHSGCNLDYPPGAKVSSRRRYEQAQELITHFWNRWLREYVPNGIERRKWLRSRRNLAVNDLVLVVTPLPATNAVHMPITCCKKRLYLLFCCDATHLFHSFDFNLVKIGWMRELDDGHLPSRDIPHNTQCHQFWILLFKISDT